MSTTAPITPEVNASAGRRVALLADAPLGDPALDRFGFAEFANALTLIVDDEETATPLTIAVSAPWGGGKSSLGCMLQTMLEQRVRNRAGDDPRLVVWFNAWEHDDAPHLGAALAASVVRAADRNRHWWRRLLSPLPNAMLQPGERSQQTIAIALVSGLAGLLVALLAPGEWTASIFGGEERAASGAGVLGAVFFGLFIARRLFTSAREAARFLDDPKSAAARGTMTEVKHQFGRLIGHATHKGRLVIIVDDLERCGADRALDVCQVASQLLAQPGVVTILLADMEPIARSAGARYAESMPSDIPVDPEEIGRRYLAKIVQLEIALPPPVPDDMRRVIREYGPSLRHVKPAPAPEPPRAGRVKRVVERLRWWPLVAWVAGVIVYAIANPAWLETEETSTFDDIMTLGLLLAIVLSVWSFWLRRRARKKRKALKREIEELKGQQLEPEEIERQVVAKTANPQLISDLVSSSFLDSEEFRAVEAFIVENPPTLPREAKRSFNHAQLMTEIARARHMFGGTPDLKPVHLAKWLVLREQWPALARAIARDPEVLDELERGAGKRDPELVELLDSGEALGAVIERLIYFQPAENGHPPE